MDAMGTLKEPESKEEDHSWILVAMIILGCIAYYMHITHMFSADAYQSKELDQMTETISKEI